jgi:hypothetical protein
MAEPDDLSIELRAASGSQAISLLFPRRILLVEALDPSIVEEPVDCPVKRPGTELHTSIAKFLDVFEESITMLGC